MQQQQQSASYDLLAVFPDETKADTAAAKLHKEGFGDEEVHQLPATIASRGQFREHGPNQGRREVFLQVQRSGPRPIVVILCTLLFTIIGAAVTFVGPFAFPAEHIPLVFLIGALIGLLIGLIIGLLQRGRVRGNIGQQATPPSVPATTASTALTVVALRFSDPENISRTSRARAILLNNQGKIDRSVTRTE